MRTEKDILVDYNLAHPRMHEGADVTQEITALRAELTTMTQERDAWKNSAAEFCRNQQYYSGLIDQAAKHIGLSMYTADDQGVNEEPLRAKLPECVEAMTQDRDSLKIIASRALDGEAALRNQLAASQAREKQLRELLGGTRKSPRIAS